MFFMIGQRKNGLVIGIFDIDALLWQRKHFFLPFSSESMFVCLMRQTWIFEITLILFVIGLNKLVLLIVIHDIDALVWHEMLFFPLLSSKSKFIHQMRETWIIVTIFVLFMIVCHTHIFHIRIERY